MTRIFLSLSLAMAAAVSAAAAAAPPVLPFSDVRSGMKGTGRTVFQGSQVETFEVEILGKLPNIGPGQNLILGRCTGGPLAQTGILAGMSGSPVYVGDKLIGAVAYSWGFSKDAIAGITPIEEILAVSARDTARPPRGKGGGGTTPASLAALREPERMDEFVTVRLPAMAARRATALPVSIPLSVSGLGASGLARISGDLSRNGFLPVQSGSAGAGAAPAPPLEPGSPIGVKLVRGDVDMTATGTVTWVDGDRVYAFGHPLFGLGAIDLPLTSARVEALLPSLQRSERIAIPVGEIGALRQDRAAAIFGRMGLKPRMIPVRLTLSGASGAGKTYSFDVAEDPLLAPILLYDSLNGILANTERVFGSMTLRLREGSVIKLEGKDDVRLDNLYAGPTAPNYATGLTAYILYVLMNNDWSTPAVSGINLLLDYEEEPRTGQIRRVTLDRYRVRPGEKVTASIAVAPYRGPEQILAHEIEIPEETPAGRLILHVGDATAVSRVDQSDDPLLPKDLSQLIWLINRLRRNDRIYILASREDMGVFLGGTRLPNLPPSVVTVLSRPRSLGNLSVMQQRGILEEDIATDYAVVGFARVQLEVEEP
jgi:hypothetical protein